MRGTADRLLDQALKALEYGSSCDHVARRFCAKALTAGVVADLDALLSAADGDTGRLALHDALVPHLNGMRPHDEPAAVSFQPIDDQVIEDLPLPEQLIDGIVRVGGFIVPYGPPATLKSLVTLDWSLCIGTGFRWDGRAVRRGSVIFVAAEGSGGLGARVRAWKTHRGFKGRAGVEFVTEPVVLIEPGHVDALLRMAGQLGDPPVLVVLDTLARCMAGYDENSTQDMGAFIRGVDRIRGELGAAVIAVHHTNAGGERERGNTALRGAADTMIEFKPDDDTVVLSCSKQKDAPPFSKLRLRFLEVGDSGVALPATEAWQVESRGLSDLQREVLATCQEIDVGDGVTVTAWVKAYGRGERTVYRARKVLKDGGFVQQIGTGRGSRWRLTNAGIEALSASLPATCHEPARQAADSLPATPPPLEGVAGGRVGRQADTSPEVDL